MDWDAELIRLMAEFGGTRLARHAHLPLQSGSDAVLRRMHRRYRPWHYAAKVDALFEAAGPELTLGADVMVGFPRETDGEFEETLEFVRALPFGYLHLFPFSPRPERRRGHCTRSAVAGACGGRAHGGVAQRGSGEKASHRKPFVGRKLDAITLHTPDALAIRGLTVALTENFLPVEMEGVIAANRLVRVKAIGLDAEGALRGHWAESQSLIDPQKTADRIPKGPTAATFARSWARIPAAILETRSPIQTVLDR